MSSKVQGIYQRRARYYRVDRSSSCCWKRLSRAWGIASTTSLSSALLSRRTMTKATVPSSRIPREWAPCSIRHIYHVLSWLQAGFQSKPHVGSRPLPKTPLPTRQRLVSFDLSSSIPSLSFYLSPSSLFFSSSISFPLLHLPLSAEPTVKAHERDCSRV